jgi:serine phosphatase RsbU (regulator of sigma subunit)
VLETIRAVESFADNVPQSDDITLLTLRYNGQSTLT